MTSSVVSIFLVCLFVVSCYSISIELGTLQSVSVNGTLICNDKPAKNVKVKLYEEEAILDVLLNERFTNDNGTFEMSGSKTEITTIDPKVNIYHTCNYDGLCVRKISIEIPTEYITNGEIPAKTYNIGELNLASKFSGQSTDCFN